MKIIIQNQILNISKPLIMRTMFALMLILGMGLSSVCAQTCPFDAIGKAGE